MRRRFLSLGLLGLLGLAVALAGGVSSSFAATPPVWGSAIEVPGTANLNKDGYAALNSVSCPAAGNCVGGGYYYDHSGREQAFVATEMNGTWGNAIEVPGTATLNAGGQAVVLSVSCSSTGNCTAGGTYTDAQFYVQAFVADETNGTWGNAIEVPNTSTLNRGDASVTSVSCAADGSCTVGGFFHDSSHGTHAFVADKTNGTWGNAIEVPGLATLSVGVSASVRSVSCATAGNCAAAGGYRDGSGNNQAWVDNETNGTWGNAVQVPGISTLNSGGTATVRSVSCPTAGNCTAGGYYRDSSGDFQTFVIDETNGSWGTAIEVPGTAALNVGGDARVTSISCTSPGNCSGGGHYYDGSGLEQAFVVDETNGTWGTAIEVPGIAALNAGGIAEVESVSCTAAGTCGAGGYYVDGSDSEQAFVVNETAGSWGTAIEVPGTATLNSGGAAGVSSVSCATADDCAAGGFYSDAYGDGEAFVAASAAVGETWLAPAPATGVYGGTTTLSATLTSGGNPVSGETVSFTLNGANVGSTTTDVNGVATLQNVSLAGIDAGSYPADVAASFAGDDNLNLLASSGSSSLTVSQLAQAIVISTHAPTNATYGDQFTVAATGGASGNPVTYGSSGSCSNTGANFTMIGSGQCTVTYDQAGNTDYSAAPELTDIVTGQKANQTITFATPASHTYGNADFDPGASASSGDAVSYSASGACSIVSGKVHLTGAGSCTVTANQAGDANYNAAPPVQRTFSVGKASLSITADDQQKLFGQSFALGTAAFTASGLVGSDSVSGVTLTSSGAAAAAVIGNYAIVPSNAVAGPNTDLAANYTLIFNNGTLHVLAPGIVGLNGVSVAASGARIDSFDSTHGVYGGSNHGSRALVMSNGPLSFSGVSLFGSATSTLGAVSVASGAGVSGNVTAGTTASVLGIVSGTVLQHTPSTPVPLPAVTACAPFSAKTGISGGSFTYASGNLTVKSGTVKLASKTYCFKNVTVSAGSTLSVRGPVTIDLTGKLTGKGQIANTTNLPANLHIVSSYAGAGGVAIVGGSHAAMTILAPKTKATISGGSYFGTLFAGAVNLTGAIQFHADQP